MLTHRGGTDRVISMVPTGRYRLELVPFLIADFRIVAWVARVNTAVSYHDRAIHGSALRRIQSD